MKFLQSFLSERAAEASDIWAALKYLFNGKPHDPTRWAETPPKGWNIETPTAAVPERKTKSVEVDLLLYTPEEILEMTESEYRQKIGLEGVQSWLEARKTAEKMITKRRKSNAREVEF